MKLAASRLRPNQLRGLATLLATAGVASVVVLGADSGFPATKVQLRAGTAWLASAQIGQVTLVDGASARVAATVPVAPAASPLRVEQQGSSAYVLNQANGTLARVDGATQRVTHRATPIPAAGGALTIRSTPRSLYTLDTNSGMLAPANLETLTPQGNPQQLAAGVAPENPVVDGRERLWAIEQNTGELVWLSDGQRQTRPAAAAPGAPRLTTTRNQPALVDPTRSTAELLNPDSGAVTRTVRPAIQPDDVITVSGSAHQSRILLTAATRGVFIVCTFENASCSAPVTISSPGSDLGVPIEVDNYAVVPDYATGQAAIIDLTTARLIAQRQLFDHPVRYELLARDGFVFFNDPASNQAGVLDLTGNIRVITKYDEANRSDGAASVPDTATQQSSSSGPNPGEQGAAPGATNPGPGIPKQPTPAPWTPPGGAAGPMPPAPAMSIAVKPGNQGLVGQDFELTLVSRAPADIARVHWQFGDGTQATAATTIHHSWQRASTFRITAAATFTNGTTAPVVEATVVVVAPGTPPRIERLNIRRETPVIGEKVHFSADITGTAPSSWLWTISDPHQPGGKITAATPEFDNTFSAPGNYTVDLTVTAADGSSTRTSRRFAVALGKVTAWGNNSAGQTTVPPDARSSVTAIAAGNDHSLALKADGSVIAWGDNSVGQTNVPPQAISGVVAISAGNWHTLALTADGSVIAWGGLNEYGEASVPAEASSGVVAVAAGAHHSLALKADGSVIAWGDDQFEEVSVPPEAKSNVIAIAAGGVYCLALKADGSVIGWGDGDIGEQWPVPKEAGSGVVAISVGSYHRAALKADGSLIVWGNNGLKQVTVPAEASTGVVAVSAGNWYNLALKADGTIIGWGDNEFGQATVPPQVTARTAIAAGSGHSLAL